MDQNAATNMNSVETTVDDSISSASRLAQILSNPVTMPEYLGDKIVTGVVTSLCYIGITKGYEKIQDAIQLKKQQTQSK